MAFLSAFAMQKTINGSAAVSPDPRPKVASIRSFSRFETPTIRTEEHGRARASTLAGSSPQVIHEELQPAIVPDGENEAASTANDRDGDEAASPIPRTSESFDELPIEIRSLTERFLESLTAPIHPTPLTIDNLAALFQDFYTKAESHIAAQIAILSTKIGRTPSPAASVASRSSATNLRNSSRVSSPVRKPSGEQQMLSASEISNRKKQRKLLELKKTAWEETVERTVVEKVYDKIYQHRTSEDQERDQKLRSRIAALSLVGIGLKELLAGADEIPDAMRQKTVEEQDKIKEMLAGARQNIQDMDTERYPLGKLQHLTLAHKSIVETLSQLFPSTSSADEILPTLIYALITSDPATVNVVSNLRFIQRFRAASKVDGEAAYCLVNLEASTSFLETVDLTSLTSTETDRSPSKNNGSHPGTPISAAPMNLGVLPATDPSLSNENGSDSGTKPLPSPSKQQRRLSNLLASGTSRINEASDSFRGAVLDSADKTYETIHGTLDTSFKFLFGRLREHQEQAGQEAVSHDVLPKTLEDARKLVSAPSTPDTGADGEIVGLGVTSTPPGEEDDTVSIKTSSSVPDSEVTLSKPVNEKVSEMFGGRRQIRDRSVDSRASTGSGNAAAPQPAILAPTSGTTPVGGPAAAIEGIRNIGNSINPLNQLSRMSGIFGRGGSNLNSPSSSTPPILTPTSMPSASVDKPLLSPNALGTRSRSSSNSDNKAIAAIESLKKITSSKKFVDIKDVKDLRIGDIEELLKEYQNLAKALENAVGST